MKSNLTSIYDEVPNVDKEVLKKLWKDAVPKIKFSKKPIITSTPKV